VLINDSDETVQFSIRLNLQSQKIEFDPLIDMGIALDHSTKAGIDRVIKFFNFRWLLMLNGCLEVWDEDSKALLGRSDPCILKNMLINPQGHKDQIAALEKVKESLPD
jgi:hypothetical protein